jgi:hypothetical protein
MELLLAYVATVGKFASASRVLRDGLTISQVIARDSLDEEGKLNSP